MREDYELDYDKIPTYIKVLTIVMVVAFVVIVGGIVTMIWGDVQFAPVILKVVMTSVVVGWATKYIIRRTIYEPAPGTFDSDQVRKEYRKVEEEE